MLSHVAPSPLLFISNTSKIQVFESSFHISSGEFLVSGFATSSADKMFE
jgi:hypothetical protein